jgi:uncharacterized protein
MRILVLCDDYWHPASTVRQGLSPLADQGYEFKFLSDAKEWSPTRMDGFPVVIHSKSDNITAADQNPWLTPDVETAFARYVRNGGGLLVVHSGTIGYKKLPTLLALIGGIFLSHPKQCPVTITPQGVHPVTVGVSPFTVTDEHYQMQLDDAHATVFMTTESANGTQPGGWTRSEGAGRVCVLTPGHNLAVWLHPQFQLLLANGLHWCSPTL